MATTTWMNLDLPVVSVTLGPTWASKLNAALEDIDEHDHSSGKGPRVTPAGLNINADLEMNGNDLTEVRSVRLENHSGSLVGASDLNAVYAYAGNLYFNNSSGTSVQLTSGGGLNSAGLVANTHAQTVVAGTHTILANDTYVTLKVNTTAARTINLPAISGVTQGRYYIFQDVSGQSETNAITLVRNGSDTIEGAAANYSLSLDNGVWWIESDGVSNWKVTRAMPDFLTKSSLTLGSTVLDTSALTVGGNTLNASGLTLPMGYVVANSYVSVGTSPAASGLVRLPNLQNVVARNAANSGDVNLIGLNATDYVVIGAGSNAVSLNNGSGHLLAGSALLTTYLSFDQNVAQGALRLANNTSIYSRGGGSYDVEVLRLDASDILKLGQGGVRQVESRDISGNVLHMGSICKFLTGSESTTTTTPVSSSLRATLPTGSWIFEVEGSVDTQAGSGGYFGMLFPNGTGWSISGWSISGAPNYTGGLSGTGNGSTTAMLFDTDGASMPFRFTGHCVLSTPGNVTVTFRPFTGGDYCRLGYGSRITFRRAIAA